MTPRSNILTALVENKSGVLNRIASLFRRRRYNIESLTVGHSEKLGLSRMTIVVNENTDIEQVFRQMYKIIEVIKIKKIDSKSAVIRDLALVKVKVTPATKAKLLKTIQLFHAEIVNKKGSEMIIQIVGQPEKINSFLDLIKVFGVVEVSRAGATAISN
ncbi:MAG: acetolactate synthase small subunit [Candidatus Gracilibacteria bacterium]|nr:acetolactate synthase small subunit [Candidatus Gracilibacteria bacterium]MDD5179167.1 acetolactate synthase small subunit [Candidatus Gracilibacteria bacterium]